MAKLTIRDADLAGRKVFVRVDFNVPMKEGEVTDATRIERALPTIEYLIGKNSRVILASHLGNPKTEEDRKTLTMDAVGRKLSGLLGKKVKKLDDCMGDDVKKAVEDMQDGDVILLENTRFHKGEKKMIRILSDSWHP